MDGSQPAAGGNRSVEISAPIARFAIETKSAALPDSARHIAKLSLLDWCAVAIAGKDEPVAKAVRNLVGDEAGSPQATAIGHPVKLPVRAAALVNGAVSHALDYDDTHFDYVGHPSVAIFPAVMAISERQNAGGAAMLEAALIGLEAACRIGAYLGTQHYNHGFHQTATAGSFGATAGVSRLLGLDQERTRHALGIAATRASGLKSQFGTMGKPYHAGLAASNGVEAATLASHGFISRPDGIECEQGFASTHAAQGGDLTRIFAGLGESYRFEHVQYKFHACCHGTHAALEALRNLRERTGLALDDVDSVTLGVNPRWLKVCNIETPRTGLEAKFSYRLTTAMALAGMETGALDVYAESTCTDIGLIRVRDRVTVAADARHADTAATVSVRTRSGAMHDAAFDLETPMPVAVKEKKLREKAAALVGAARAEKLWSVISAIEQRPARDLAALIRA